MHAFWWQFDFILKRLMLLLLPPVQLRRAAGGSLPQVQPVLRGGLRRPAAGRGRDL